MAVLSPELSTTEKDLALMPQGMQPDQTMTTTARVDESSGQAPELLEKNIGEAFQEDIRRQRGQQISDEELSNKFLTIIQSPDLDSAVRANDNDPTFGGLALSDELLERLRTDEEFKNKAYLSYMDSEKIPVAKPEELVVPGEYGLPDEVFEGADFEFKQAVDAIITKNVNIKKALQSDHPNFSLDGKRMIMNKFAVGDTYEEFVRTIANLPGDVARIPYIFPVITNGVGAAIDAATGEASFGDALPEEFGKRMSQSGYIQGSEAFLNEIGIGEFQPFESRVQSMQKWYKKNFIETYGQDEWEKQHTSALIQLNADGTKEYIRDEDGRVKRKDVGLPPEVAQSMLDLAFNELPFISKVGLIFAQQAGFTAGGLKLAQRSALKYVNEIDAAREANPLNFANKTDLEVYRQIRTEKFKDEANGIFKAYFGGRNLLERIGVRSVRPVRGLLALGRRGKIEMGRNMQLRTSTIESLNQQIDDIAKEIDSLTPKIGKPSPENVAKIEVLKNNSNRLQADVKAYRNIINKNPYMTAVMRDEVIISTAIGLSTQFLPDMSVYGVPTEMIAAVTAPLVSPFAVGALSRATWSAGDSITEGLFTDIAELLQNTDMIPLIPRDALMNADERAMKEALNASGYNLSDDRIKSFEQFNRILRALPTDDGAGGNPRQDVVDALARYRDMMQSYDQELRDLGFSDERIAQIMPKLNLGVAQASGLAPLIAYQDQKIHAVTAGKLVNSNDLAALVRATADEGQLARGIDANITIIREMFAAEGIQLLENSPLQKFVTDLETGAKTQQEALRQKEMALVQVFDQYTKNIAQLSDNVDDTVVADMYKLAQDLEKMSILPEGTVEGLVKQGQFLERAQVNMLQSVNEQSAALAALSKDMERSEFIAASRKNADSLLDVAIEGRTAKATAKYVEVDNMLGDRTFDLAVPLQKMLALSGDALDVPITSNLTDFGKWLKSDGKLVARTIEQMAMRNLVQKVGFKKEDLQKYMEQNGFTSYTDLAFDMINKDKDPELVSKIFSATFSESENLYRFFEIRATGARSDNFDINKAKTEIRRLITDTYGDLDPAVQRKVEEARAYYRTEVGSVTDPNTNTWAGTALKNRVRVEDPDRTRTPQTEGNYGYRGVDRNHPEVPFLNMASISQKLLNTKDSVEAGKLIKDLYAEQDRILYAIGGKRNELGNIEFDLNDPSQEQAFNIYKNLMQAHQQFAVTNFFRSKTELAQDILQEGMGDLPKDISALRFDRAHRLFEIENALAVDVIEKGTNNRSVRRTLEADSLENLALDFDELLLNNKQWQDGYNDLRGRLDPTKGVLTVAAKQEAEDISNIIRTLQLDAKLANKKETFFDVYFANATPDSYKAKIKELQITSGLSEDEVKKAMKYMYMEGLMAKSKTRFKVTGTTGEESVSLKGELFSMIVSDPNQLALMEEILGPKMTKAMKRFQQWADTAGGDALDFRREGARGVMTIDSAFSRIFNVARGMVSPLYVGTELATRVLLLNKQNLMDAALRDPEAALIMADILQGREVTKQDVKVLGRVVEGHLAAGVAATGNNIPTLDEILAQEEYFRTHGTIINPMQTSPSNEEETDETVQ